jgi:hypothetical protein
MGSTTFSCTSSGKDSTIFTIVAIAAEDMDFSGIMAYRLYFTALTSYDKARSRSHFSDSDLILAGQQLWLKSYQSHEMKQ